MKIFVDSGNINEILKWVENPIVEGVTTNPTLMHKAGVKDYEGFAKDILANTDKPVSFEVFSDEWDEMERQARKIASWGENVYVKIPITNTKGELSLELIEKLNGQGIKINVTAVFTFDQIGGINMAEGVPIIFSVFAGRIADTGIDPSVVLSRIVDATSEQEVLWASPREVLNIYQAEEAGADIITCTPALIKKYEELKGKDLEEFSLDTVKMFYKDGKDAGFIL